MADTNFIDRHTPINADWLNYVNRLAYDLPSLVSGKGSSLVGSNDAGGYYDGTNVEEQLQDLGQRASGVANVLTYGADGTGSADSTTAVQNALSTSKHVVVPVGHTFKLSSQLNMTTPGQVLEINGVLLVQNRRWLKIDGAPRCRVIGTGEIRYDATVTDNNVGGIGAGIHITNSPNCRVEDIWMSTLTTDRTKTGIVTVTKSSYGVHVKGIQATDIGQGVVLGWTDEVAEQDAGSVPTSRCRIYNNTFVTCGRPAYAVIMSRTKSNSYSRTDPYAWANHKVWMNTIDGLGGTGTQQINIEMWGNGNTIDRNTIVGNLVDTVSHIGVSLAKAYDCKVIGNEFSGLWNYQGVELATANNCIVSKNTFYGFTNASSNCACVGISVAVVGDPISTGNIVSDNEFVECKVGVITSGTGTATPYCTKTTISGNTFTDMTGNGVLNLGGATKIVGNDFSGATPISVQYGAVAIRDNDFTTTSSFCISTETTADKLDISGNRFTGWGVTGQNAAILLRNQVAAYIHGNTFRSDGRSQSGWTYSMTALVKSSVAPGLDVAHKVGVNHYDGVNMQMASAVSSFGPINTNGGYAFSSDISVSGVSNKVVFGGSAPVRKTWAAGDRMINVTTTVGQPKGWRCTVSSASTTGSISAGTNTLTLAAASTFANGQGITVAGAGAAGADLETTITSGGGTTNLVLAASAGTTVASAVTTHAGTWTSEGNL